MPISILNSMLEMTLTELRYLIALGQEKNFSRAAKRCFISQPSLSFAVKKIEEELSVEIFERYKNELRLTAIGLKIIEQAQRVLEETALIKEIVNNSKDQLKGALKIGVIYTVAPYLLPKLMSKLRLLAPQMPLMIEEDYTINLRRKLIEGMLDVIIISLPFVETGILTKPLYEEPFVVLMPHKHKLTAYKTVEPQNLIDEEILLLGAGHCFRDQVLAACPECLQTSKKSIGMNYNYQGSSLETIRTMVASGLGITILPSTAAESKQFGKGLLSVREFKQPEPTRQIALAWRSSFPRTKVISVFNTAIMQIKLPGVEKL